MACTILSWIIINLYIGKKFACILAFTTELGQPNTTLFN
jgi:hypothetical protein